MARIHLLDRDHVEQPAGAGFMAPDAVDARQSGLFDLVPDHCRFYRGAREGEVFRRPRRDGEREDRVGAVIDALDLDDGQCRRLRGVIAHELAKRPFLAQLVAIYLALDDQLRMGRDRQAVDFRLDDVDGASAYAAGIGQLVDLMVDFLMRHQEQQRIVAAGNQHRAGLALGEIFLAYQPSLLPGRHPDRDRILVMHHHAIGRGIDPAGVGVPHDDGIVGADIAAAIQLMDERGGELP